LEFLRYPHVIPRFFNIGEFGPPRDFTPASTCTWVGHPVSGLLHATCRPFKTRFPFGSVPSVLNLAAYNNSPDRSTKSTQSSLNALLQFVNIGFQVLFHSPPGVLFTFPSRYLSSIGHQVVFSLGRWSSLLPTGFLVPRGTPDYGLLPKLSHTGLLPSAVSAFHPLILLAYSVISPFLYPLPDFSDMVWALPLSLATTYGITLVFFSCGYLDVSVPHVSPRMTIYSSFGTRFLTPGGFPHSDIHGSMAICASPWLFAACHVLLRLLVPRHSPYALHSLILLIFF
jgi:hypothetical protein